MKDGTEGDKVDIVCYSNCDTIELFINGKSLGENNNNVFEPKIHRISYEKGTLKAIGRRKGVVVCENEIKTYGQERKIVISPDKCEAFAGDVVIFDVFLKDEFNQTVKTASNKVRIKVENGEIIGAGNGDNANHASTISQTQELFHGCAQWIVRAGDDEKLVFEVEYEDKKESIQISLQKGKAQLSVPGVPIKIYASRYMMSDIHESYPKAEEITDTFYTWIPTTVGVKKSVMMSGKTGFATVSGVIEIPAHVKAMPQLTIENIRGNFDVYFCREKVYSSNGFYEGDVNIPCETLIGETNATIGIVFRLSGEECGIKGFIYAEC